MKVLSPSKVNFGLWVLYKRSDGFHEIRSVFLPVDLYDEIEINHSELIRIIATEGPEGDENIVFKVLKVMSEELNKFLSADIFIKKSIPIGGGLGGGSSNAAAIIKAVNEIYGLNLESEKLLNIALKIGSDVPFFILQEPAIVRGRGDEIERLDIKFPYYFLIHYPGFKIDTSWAYSVISKFLSNDYKVKERSFESLVSLLRDGKFKEALLVLENDFERVVFKKFPDYLDLISFYKKKGAIKSFLTGSGSCLVSVFEDKINIEVKEGKLFWCKQWGVV
ncbi:MAG: 4-(cytidine 5'-diphospho)-2-C-methyl-D-erythritol kinase [Candidatus Hydrothermales bacterium]